MGREIRRTVPLLFALLVISMPAFAQVDLTGSWAPRLYEDYIERGPGSDLGDFTGMPMNDEARAKALLYTSNLPSTVERQCLPQAPWVMQYRPRGISIWAEEDRDGQVIAWKLGGDYLRDTVTIWMDGRPHPPEYAQHTWQGFSTGSWDGDVLVVKTTHLKAGWMRRNGLPLSDRATMTDRFHRYGDVMTHVMIVEDPVYLTEPLVKTNGFLLAPAGTMTPYPCEPVIEVVREPGFVPHYLPGKNPFLREFGEHYGLPPEATRGGAATALPEFAEKLR